MKLKLWLCGLVALGTTAVNAQDLTITNARIIDGTGRVIDRGSIVVRDGKIASVAAGAPSAPAGRRLDAGGKTVMPGFIDAHRHLIAGDPSNWLADTAPKELQDFLDAGFTTVLSAIDPPPIIQAKHRIDQGELAGPRLFAGAFIPVAGPTGPPATDDPARTDASRGPRNGPPAPAIPRERTIEAVHAAKQNGYDYLKVVFIITPNGPELDTLKLIVEEGKKIGMPTIVHAVSVIDTLTAIEAHPDVLVHTPHIGRLDDNPYAVRKIVEAKIPMTSTLAVFLPHFAPADNTPLFRDAKPFPWNTLSSAGQGPVNARLLWNAGIVSYGYGTDTQWPPKQTLLDELRALELVFSPADIVKIITKNAANSTLHQAEIGTLEPGKFADIVVVDGDPLTDSRALLHVTTTIKGGEIVFRSKE